MKLATIPRALVMLAMASVLLPAARGDFTVGNQPLAPADATTFPGGVNPVSVKLEASATFSFTEDHTGTNYTYDHEAMTLKVTNTADADKVKHVWLHMQYTPGHAFPQDPNAVFDPTKWPSIINPAAGVTVTGASVLTENTSNGIYMTWDIKPQPESETFKLDFPALGGDAGGIFLVEVKTICTAAVPEPASLAMLGAGIFGVMVHTRRKANLSASPALERHRPSS